MSFIHATFWPALQERNQKKQKPVNSKMQNSWQTLKRGKISWNKSTFYSKVVWLKCCGKSFLKPCFLFSCILVSFAFKKRTPVEHTSLKAFFFKPKTSLLHLQPENCLKGCAFLWVTVWLKLKLIMPAVKGDKKKPSINPPWRPFVQPKLGLDTNIRIFFEILRQFWDI